MASFLHTVMVTAHTLIRSFLLILVLLLMSAGIAFFARQGRELISLVALLALVGAMIISRRPDLGILLFLTTFFVRYPSLPQGGPFSPNNLLGFLFAGLFFLKIFHERDLWFLQERSLQIYIALVLFIFISSHIAELRFGNPFPELDATNEKLERFEARSLFLLFFVHFIQTYRDLRLVFWTLVVLILLTAVSAVPGPGNYRTIASMGIAAAGNPNWFAFFCEFGIALLWSYRHVVRRKWLWVLLTAAVGGLAIIALMTASRSGFLNLLLLCALITMQGRFGIKRQLQTALVIVLVGYFAASHLSSAHLERLGNILPGSSSATKGSGSQEDRLQTVQHGLKMIAREPLFGVGIGNFTWFHLQMSEVGMSTAPHNSYLWAAAEGGIPLLLLYLLLFGSVFISFRRVEQETTHPEVRVIAGGLRLGLLVFLSFSFFAEFWLNVIMYILIGFAVVLKRLHERERLANYPDVAPRGESRAGLAGGRLAVRSKL